MNATHFHLLINHIPILGSFFGLALLAAGAVSHGGRLWLTRAAFAFFIVVGATAIPANLSGEEAEDQVEKIAGVTHHAIHEHEEAAEAAWVVASILGAVSLGAWLLQQRNHRLQRPALLAVWALAMLTAGLMARTGYEGGLIRRPELRGELNQGIDSAERAAERAESGH